MLYTNFLNRETLKEELTQSFNKLFHNINDIKKVFSGNGVVDKDSYHFMVKLLQPSNRTERIFYELIFKMSLQSELLGAGAGVFGILFLLELYNELFKINETIVKNNEFRFVEDYQKEEKELLDCIASYSRTARKEDVVSNVENICEKRADLAKTILEALYLAGMEGAIHLVNGKQPSYIVELKHGYHFDLIPYKFFFQNNTWEEKNVKVLLIDGVLEHVSEIEHLLLKSVETKIPMLIIAQGFEEEVVATLKANQDRKIFNIIPVRIQPDLEGLNVLNDLACVVGSDVVSSLKGEQIVFVKYDSIPSVESVSYSGNRFVFYNSSTRHLVCLQIKSLLEKLNQASVIEDISTLFNKRIQSLLAHSVEIRLPDMNATENDSVRIKIDVALRTVKSLLSHGIINFDEALRNYNPETQIGEKMKIALENTIKRLGKTETAALAAYSGIHFAGSLAAMLSSSAGMVKIED
jgi:chaperonin GroEL